MFYAVLALSTLLAACSAPQRRPQRVVHAPAWRQGTATANDILFRAIALVGTPYRYGGNTPDVGFDCSGLVDYVFGDVAGIALPRTADDIGRIDAPDVGRDDLRSGDLVFFHHRGRKISHIGIYVGEGRFVHAPNEGGTVRLDRLDDIYWRDHFSFAKRVL
jgi:cell wall-associated NlpC family hydrolase